MMRTHLASVMLVIRLILHCRPASVKTGNPVPSLRVFVPLRLCEGPFSRLRLTPTQPQWTIARH